jgi:hypothetical protein
LHNDVISDSIPNVYVFKMNSLACDLPCDGSTADIERESPCIDAYRAIMIPVELVSVMCTAEMILIDFIES